MKPKKQSTNKYVRYIVGFSFGKGSNNSPGPTNNGLAYSIYKILQDAEINPANYEVEVQGSSGLGGVFSILLSFLPLILFGGIFLIFLDLKG